MKVATTIQISADEDREIGRLREALNLPTKRAVVREGLEALRKMVRDQARRRRLQAASRLVRGHSVGVNREWSSLSSAVKVR